MRILSCLLGCALLAGPAGLAGADPVLGEPWEEEIERGLTRQRQEERSLTPDALVGKYERAARRDATVPNLYLLGRAYGLRAQARAAQAAAGPSADLVQRDRASAAAAYEDALRHAPRCYYASHDLGVLALQRDPPDTTAAFAHFQRVYQAHPRFTPTLRQLVNLYTSRKQHDAAVSLLRTILEVEPEDDEARLRLAGLLADLGHHDKAYAEVDRVLARNNRVQPLALLAQAQIDLATGRLDRASAVCRRLASASPTWPTPPALLARIAQAKREKDPADRSALEDLHTALTGLHRVERDPERRERLATDLRSVEAAMAAPVSAGGQGPPTTAQALALLARPEEDARAQALLFLMVREEVPPAEEQREMLRAIAAHTAPQDEPSPKVRAVAVTALGRLFGTPWMWVVRKALRDPDGRVVAHVADTLAGIAKRDADALGAVVAALARHAGDASVEGASACRLAILDLCGTSLLGLPEDADDAEHRRAFREWWTSAAGEDRLVESLRAYPRARDPHAHEVLVPYLLEGDFFVGRAAFEALRATQAIVREPALAAWHARRPALPEGTALTKEAWESARASVLAWARAAPER
jgi:tetratricopeptide (TPR) repeat protein